MRRSRVEAEAAVVPAFLARPKSEVQGRSYYREEGHARRYSTTCDFHHSRRRRRRFGRFVEEEDDEKYSLLLLLLLFAFCFLLFAFVCGLRSLEIYIFIRWGGREGVVRGGLFSLG